MPGPPFIGIDGGATKCRARIVDASGRTLGESTIKASANIASRGPEPVMGVILRAVKGAARLAGLTEKEWRSAYAGFGLAGGDVKSAGNELLRLLKQQGYFRHVDIRTDAYVTWLGAFRGEDGAILILGTGSCGLAVVKGVERYVAGYGPQVSDEASGQWLGRAAVRRALWALDGRIERTALAQEILGRFHESPEEIVTFANKASAAVFGELAPLVFDYALEGDALAVAIVGEAAADGERIITRLLDLGASSVYLHGGIAEPLAARLRPAIRKYLKKSMNVDGVPLEGATLLARRMASGGDNAKR
jgi:glucosamine kinase